MFFVVSEGITCSYKASEKNVRITKPCGYAFPADGLETILPCATEQKE